MRPDVKWSLDNYVSQRIPTGGFLQAVLENNLLEAFGSADSDNLRDLQEIVQYCYWELPSSCWGSPQKVREWLSPKEDSNAVK